MSAYALMISAVLVFGFSGLMAMAGLGAAFLFVPLFYYLGVPLEEAVPTALLLNVASLLFAPLGARFTSQVDPKLLLGLFTGFLIFAGFMMLFYRSGSRERRLGGMSEMGLGVGVGGVAGFLGGLLGVGGGNFIVPALAWMGVETKIAAGTTAMVVVFASLSGFLGHATMGVLRPGFVGLMAAMAIAGSIIGSHLMKTKLSSAQLKKIIGVLLWLIAVKMAFDLSR